MNSMTEVLRRRILDVTGRHVHLWTGGHGPAVILIHGSPGNAWLVTPLAQRLAGRFRVYAVDSPGFGLSDELPGEVLCVAQLADAYRDLLDALGLGKVLVYGTHTGAAIGLELSFRHPQRVAGFVLEGVPAFTLDEQRPLLAPEYMVHFEPEALGGHYARTWTRFHDQFVWFPWYRRVPANLNEAAAGSAADIHLWVEMYFQALRHEYRPAYLAAIRYGSAALTAAAAILVPGVYMAERSDMLFSHLDRLPPLRDGQRIERVMSPEAVPATIEAALCSLPRSDEGPPFNDGGPRPEDAAPRATPERKAEYRFHDLPDGQVLVRSRGIAAGVPAAGVPVLLLHDAPGAGRAMLGLYHALSAQSKVLLPDLPGCGESDPLRGDCTVADYVGVIAEIIEAIAGEAVFVYGVGFGAALALALNSRHPNLVRGLALTGLLRVTGAERRGLIARLAPPITLADDGSHWYRTWLMLRDSLVRWPWFERSPTALRRQSVDLDPDALHDWTCDVMRQWHSYHRVIDAVLAWDPDTAMHHAAGKLTVAIDSRHALYADDLVSAAQLHRSVNLPDDPADRARVLAAVAAASTRPTAASPRPPAAAPSP
jgi:pimeloyl-ACP methyl ester carboxylesterase